MTQPNSEFVIVASHLERLVEVYNPRLDRWESEHLQDLVDCVPWEVTYQTLFHHAGRTRLAKLKMGCFLARLPETHQKLGALVAQDDLENRTLVLLTNVPLKSETLAKEV